MVTVKSYRTSCMNFSWNREFVIILTRKAKKRTLVGKAAPNWSLMDADNNIVSLKNLKSKILLLDI